MFYDASSPDLSKDVGLNTSTTLLHLKPYSRYKVEVQAFTGAGGGKKASVSVKTDETGLFHFSPQGLNIHIHILPTDRHTFL